MSLNRRTFLKQVGLGAAGIGLVSSFPGCATGPGKVYAHLPRSTPEAQGVSSSAILRFLDGVADSKHEFHSFMMVRHGHVIAEGWWTPYRENANHMLYSLSKSFTSTAVGFAVTEGKLTVEDQVISFFPNDLPATVSPNLAALKVKHLLTMSVGRSKDSLVLVQQSKNWVKAFLAAPIEHAPGTVFLYDSGASFMLSAIVQKVIGERELDYLRPRLFRPLDIHGETWETNPQGINTGGWGLSVTTEALAKFGQFYLQQGKWNGRQLLPESWIHEATTFKIQQPPPRGETLAQARQNSDWAQGYCYQFWRCRHHAFRGDGAYGQFTIVMPEEDAVAVITCQTSDMQGELNLVWDYLLPGIKDTPLPPDLQMQGELKRRLDKLALPFPWGRLESPNQNRISGHIYRLEPNSLGAKSVCLRFPYYPPLLGLDITVNTNKLNFDIPDQSLCSFTLTDADGPHVVRCGLGKWFDGICDVPGTPPALTLGKLRPCKVAASGIWKDPTTFEMTWRYYETPHHDTVTCHFDGDKVTVRFTGSLPGQIDKRPVLEGKI